MRHLAWVPAKSNREERLLECNYASPVYSKKPRRHNGNLTLVRLQLERFEFFERLRAFAHLFRRGHYRFDNFFVARAAANIAMHEMFELRFAGRGVFIE